VGSAFSSYYDGGTATDGSSGPNLGVAFVGLNATQSTPGNGIGYNAATVALGNIAAGFTSLSFDRWFFSNGLVEIYSGEDLSGTLLASVQFAGNVTSPLDNPAFTSIAFAGVARSFSLSGQRNQYGIDNLTFDSAVPEPATWAMMIGGLALVGAGARRRTTTVRLAAAER
jgi:hypothetical protein